MGKRSTVAAELRAAGLTVGLPLAARALGVHRSTAYELAARGELGVPVLRVGSRLRVPTAELLRVLGMDEAGGDDAACATTEAAAG